MSSLTTGCSVLEATPFATAFTAPNVAPPRHWPTEELRLATKDAASWSDWLPRAGRLTAQALSGTGVLAWQAASPKQTERLIGLTFPAEGLSAECHHALRELARQAQASGRAVIASLPAATEQIVAVSLPRHQATDAVLLVLLAPQIAALPTTLLWMTWVSTCAELWSRTHEPGLLTQRETANAPLVAKSPASASNTRSDGAPLAAQTSRGKWLAGAAVVALAAMALPVPYHVSCDCELQPVTRRFVAAPFEGLLEQAFVEVGDPVSAGQLLARMDGKEVRWELAGQRAEYERAAKERDASLADQDFGEAQLAKLQMERLGLTAKLLEQRQERLDIRSPIDGIVVSGEQKRAEGVRLSLGQSLFEIAPLDRMIVEVLIPESELAHVTDNAEATIRLEAFPSRPLNGNMQRICPRAELRNQQQVFIAEIPLSNVDGSLRPGMRGRASLPAGHATLGWRLFHRAWNKLSLWWGG